MEWSDYQKQIFDFVQDEKGSAVIIAVAGSGKTSTIVECANLIPTNLAVTFCAFNKSIAQELATRLPGHVGAQTLNSMGYRALIRYLDNRGLKLDSRKTHGIITEYMVPDQAKLYGAGIRKLVGLAKAHGIVPRHMAGTALMLDTEQNWVDLMEHYDVEFEVKADPFKGIEYARQILGESIKRGQWLIDFDDQLYLPVIWQANFDKRDLLFVDEAQDVNPVQRAMIRMALKPEGRGIFVGDPCQAIYGFRGADTEAISHIKEEFAAKEFPLSVSYRCPRSVVRYAQQYVDYIQPSKLAPEGRVLALGGFGPNIFKPTDAILCRNTAPLINMAFCILKTGMACKVLGRDIGQGLVRLIRKMDASNIEELEGALEAYKEREIRKLITKGKEELASVIEDRVGTITIFIDQLSEDARTIDHLIDWVGRLFSDNDSGILTLSTVHKAKGLEWERVFILDPFLMPLSAGQARTMTVFREAAIAIHVEATPAYTRATVIV